MHINSTTPKNNINFTALKISPASKRYLQALDIEELVMLRRIGKKMASYRHWDLEIAGYGPVIKNRRNPMKVIDDFRPDLPQTNNYKKFFDNNPAREELFSLIDSKKSPLEKAIEITKQLEIQSKSKQKTPVTKEDYIKILNDEFFAWQG